MMGVFKKQNSEWSAQYQSQCFKGDPEPCDKYGHSRTSTLNMGGVWEPFVKWINEKQKQNFTQRFH